MKVKQPNSTSTPQGNPVKGSQEGFTPEEQAAMKARAKELKADARKQATREGGERDVLAKIAEMPPSDRAIAERLHAIIKASAPGLAPKTWYGMPAYANEEGKVVCFFRGAQMFKERYFTFGFNQEARLDDGTMWPIAFALTGVSDSVEKSISDLVGKAVGV